MALPRKSFVLVLSRQSAEQAVNCQKTVGDRESLAGKEGKKGLTVMPEQLQTLGGAGGGQDRQTQSLAGPHLLYSPVEYSSGPKCRQTPLVPHPPGLPIFILFGVLYP
ncbi:hypothetical protein CRG98_004847 [Punica granatum]|uniref:Uncharacterized protein n=1 Tax=Punica granatum TaxID=22663 RepID=A0A2I0L222_PUNGR|nr:hypothetical protein CRG98_004847 [Punica granatum]